MSTHFDISELAVAVAGLEAHASARKLAVVVPIAEGAREVVEDYLSEGPPFDPAAAGLGSHEVFVTDNEVIFVFGAPGGVATLERILAEPDFWDVVSSWEHVVAGRPHLAELAFDWHA